MADKREDQLTTASDMAYVRALDSNGNSIRISKADLASVVAELIGTATLSKNGLMPKNLLPTKFIDLHNVDSLKIGQLNNRGQCLLIASSHPYTNRVSVYLVLTSYIDPSFVFSKITLKEGDYFELYYDDDKYIYAKTVNNVPIDILVVPFNVNSLTMKSATLPSSVTKM